MKTISNITIDTERAFYASKETQFNDVHISGPADGESAFKECFNIIIIHSTFDLRYPFWHNNYLTIERCIFSATCRAALWYSNHIVFNNSTSVGIKTFRECNDVTLINSTLNSEEVFWRCQNIKIKNSRITGFYAFFESKNIEIEQIDFDGKYSFQYVGNMIIKQSRLKTKDAFWHTKNVSVYDSVIEGEYLGWYSEDLTLVNCHIKGTQPLCYCKNLKLVNCTFDKDADLAFEYSEVYGNIVSPITSIKNPLKGHLEIVSCGDIIFDENDRSNGQMIIKSNNKNYF